MKIHFTKAALIAVLFMIAVQALAQHKGKINVGGDVDKFYPVVFKDGNFWNHLPTVLQIGRSDTHENAPTRGSVIAKFTFHSIAWGHGSSFVDCDIHQYRFGYVFHPMIAAYKDVTVESETFEFVLWLRGNTSYTYNCDVAQSPKVYDNVQYQLPYVEPTNKLHSFRTTVDQKLNYNGKTINGTLYAMGTNNNYLESRLGIGTWTPTERLEVKGKIRAQEIKVEATNWPDYVFNEDYNLMSLEETYQYIKQNGHLPEIPTANDVEQDGISLGEMNKLLLKKIEELTLHLIELKAQVVENGAKKSLE